MRTFKSILVLVSRCTFPGFVFLVEGDNHGQPWLQVTCPDGKDTVSGEPMFWKGRKWKLSLHMTDTEIVQTVWAAVQRALEHEAAELFKFDDAAIFDRHIDVHRLAELRSKPGVLDGREEPSVSSAKALSWLVPCTVIPAHAVENPVDYWRRPENRPEAIQLGFISEEEST